MNEKIDKYIKKLADELNEDIKDEFSREQYQKCADFGLLSMMTPSSVGGMAEKPSDILNALKSMGYHFHDNGLSFVVTNSAIISAFAFPKYASEEMSKDVYPGLFNGEYIGSYAITEANSGSDTYSMSTSVKRENGVLMLNGRKMYISNASIADVFIVAAKDDNGKISLVMLKKGDEGLSVGRQIHKMGLNNCPMAELIIDNCTVSEKRIVGKYGSGMLLSSYILDWERCCNFASHLGTMKRIYERCKEYIRIRKQFGQKIGEYQLISSKVVKMKIAVDMAELLLEKIGTMRDIGKSTFLESAMFKYYVGEEYAKCCTEALQIFGAYGYCTESGIEREVRDALGGKIYSGTSEIQLEIMAKMLGIK